ncbi:MAG: arsenic efflux protein [Clostridia bacterium]|nr:arsenic efflux protein [Clostridia bacterium]
MEWDWLLDALLDSLKLLPFLFIAYVLIEFLETLLSKRVGSEKFYKGRWAPLVGSSFGMIPQCGFSVVATDLYSRQKITVGTLIAIFISTSDEAVPILLSNMNSLKVLYMLLALIACKLVIGVVAGYLIDFINSKIVKTKPIVSAEVLPQEEASEEHNHDHANLEEQNQEVVHKGCCGHDIEEDHVHPAKQYVLHPLIHTLKIFAYILVVNVLFGLLIYFVGEERIAEFLTSAKYFTPLVACLIGLIPNCASSVVLTNLMLIGGLSFSACLAGLIVNAGIAYLVLFKQNKNQKANFAIIGIMAAIGIITGYAMMLFGI